MNAEKNAVDISKLFSWGNEFSILGRNGKEVLKVYMRLVGDAELGIARVFGLRKAAELRKSLRDINSEKRVAYIPDIESVEKPNLIEMVLILSINNIARDSVNKIDVPFPKEPPSNSTQEEQEIYQKEVDEYPKKREEAYKKILDDASEKMRGELSGLTKEDLYNKYVNLSIDSICEKEMLQRFNEMCAYYGTFSDKGYKTRLFHNYEEFENLPTDVKDQFLSHYSSLEIDFEELKK